jgi:hypothetical protein
MPPLTTPSNTLTPTQCDALESLLSDLERHAVESARLADEHRVAVATADTAALARCVAAQQRSASELTGIESRRTALLRSIGLRATAQGGVTLSQLAALAPAAKAQSLTAAAARVKTLLSDAAQRRESVRLASLSLMAHMAGVVRQIARYMSDTKTYAPPYRIAAAAGLTAGTVDFTT